MELRDVNAFSKFVADLNADALPESPRKPGYVPCTYLCIVERQRFLGSLVIRHELNEFLLEEGGHIGYSVRPSARGRGYATRALGEALSIARNLGVSHVLLTCAEGNAASRTIIEKNGGVYEDSRRGTRRYWIYAGLADEDGSFRR
ncbi:GNAT family N-acetyltransferase [Pseudarthrobacter sp. NamE5]|uniref:GNAT family N-acetyltransferase n=1 Tax=Pseudarthrobacter sp. NamE5 TaxID=2576839 RepID=UPI001F0E14B5|nr:GNAT family N-acetyltransferase [Pseudarthrobacter sp. NamE5]